MKTALAKHYSPSNLRMLYECVFYVLRQWDIIRDLKTRTYGNRIGLHQKHKHLSQFAGGVYLFASRMR